MSDCGVHEYSASFCNFSAFVLLLSVFLSIQSFFISSIPPLRWGYKILDVSQLWGREFSVRDHHGASMGIMDHDPHADLGLPCHVCLRGIGPPDLRAWFLEAHTGSLPATSHA